jgi:hypothetical protein
MEVKIHNQGDRRSDRIGFQRSRQIWLCLSGRVSARAPVGKDQCRLSEQRKEASDTYRERGIL